MRLEKTTLSHFLSQVLLSVAGFGATFAIARVLGADGVGIYALGVALLVWIDIPVTGTTSAITKRMSEGDRPSEFLSAGLVSSTILGLCLASLIWVFSDLVNDYVGASVALVLVCLLLGEIEFSVVRAVLQGERRVAVEGWLTALERIVRTGFQVGFLLLGYQILGLFWGHAISLVGLTVVGGFVVSTPFAVPSREDFGRLLDYAKYSWLGSMKTRTFGWMDTLVLGLFVGPGLIGIYEVAWSLASVLVLVSNSVVRTLFPEISEMSDNLPQIHSYLSEGMVWVGVFLIPGFFGVLVVGGDVLQIYDPEFRRGRGILLLLIVARTLDAFGRHLISAINAIDRPDVSFRINGLFVGSNLFLNVVLISLFGWYGAAVATTVSGLVVLLYSYRSLTSLIGSPRIPWRALRRQTIAAGVMSLGVWSLHLVLPSGHYLTVFVVVVGAGIYLGVLLLISSRVRQKTSRLVLDIVP